MQLYLFCLLSFTICCQAAFLNNYDSDNNVAAQVEGSLDEAAEKQRFVFLQVKQTVTSTYTSTMTSSTFGLCMTSYLTASSCFAEGRKKRSVETPPQVEPVIQEAPVHTAELQYEEREVREAPANAERQGKFLVQTTKTTTTTTTTSTSYVTTATIAVTAYSCNTNLVVPLSVCAGK